MHPYVDLGFIKLPSYGLMLAIAFFASLMVGMRRAESRGISREYIAELAFWVVLFGIAGGRLYFVLEHYGDYVHRPWRIFFLWEGGLGIYGALLSGFIAGVIYVRKRGLSFLKTSDVTFSVLPLGQGIGRIGCFLAGCCYGAPCECPVGVVFKDPHSLAPIGVRLYPTQLFESLAGFVIFLILSFLFNRVKEEGLITSLYMILYGLARFTIEFYRGDTRSYIGPISTPQFFSLFFIFVGILLLVYIKYKRSVKKW